MFGVKKKKAKDKLSKKDEAKIFKRAKKETAVKLIKVIKD